MWENVAYGVLGSLIAAGIVASLAAMRRWYSARPASGGLVADESYRALPPSVGTPATGDEINRLAQAGAQMLLADALKKELQQRRGPNGP